MDERNAIRYQTTPTDAPDGSLATLFLAVSTILGAVVLCTGLTIAYKAASTAWELFDNQSRVVALAGAIEEHAHLNSFVHRLFVQGIRIETNQPNGGSVVALPGGAPLAPTDTPNFSYLSAWAITIALLALIGNIGGSLGFQGGRLAFYSARAYSAATRERTHQTNEQSGLR